MGSGPVPVLDQCEHFYMMLYFPLNPCTGPGPIPVQCEYTITRKHSSRVCTVRVVTRMSSDQVAMRPIVDIMSDRRL